jgi:flagellar biosynthesis protein FlhA
MSNSAANSLAVPTPSKNSDIYMAVALIGILALMIIPLPAFLLDLFLATNITIALVILLVCLYTLQPLDFSVFPSM